MVEIMTESEFEKALKTIETDSEPIYFESTPLTEDEEKHPINKFTEFLMYRIEMKYYPQKVQDKLKFFDYNHLPKNLQEVSKLYYELAYITAKNNPEAEETYEALQKLLEAKDCAVRAKMQTMK